MFGLVQNHFDKVTLNPPAKPDEIRAMSEQVQCDLGELAEFLSIHNGLSAGLLDDLEGQIFSVGDMLKHYPIGYDEDIPFLRYLIPIQGDGCGNYYCYISGNVTGSGSVVFWDHETPEGVSYLAGGTLYAFFEHWIKWLVTCHTPDGKLRPEYESPQLNRYPWYGQPLQEFPWPFDEQWLRKNDNRASELLDSSEFQLLIA